MYMSHGEENHHNLFNNNQQQIAGDEGEVQYNLMDQGLQNQDNQPENLQQQPQDHQEQHAIHSTNTNLDINILSTNVPQYNTGQNILDINSLSGNWNESNPQSQPSIINLSQYTLTTGFTIFSSLPAQNPAGQPQQNMNLQNPQVALVNNNNHPRMI